MEGFAVLLGLIGIGLLVGVPVAAFVALARTSRFDHEIANLRALVNALQTEIGTLRRPRDDHSQADPRPSPVPKTEPTGAAPEDHQRKTHVPAQFYVPVESKPTPPAPILSEPAPTIAEAVQAPLTPEQPPQVATTLPAETAAAVRAPAARAETLEERLGVRLFIWVGGIALALAGAFLVKYSIDQGWLGPNVRCALGGALGLALLAGGEWVRARDDRIAQSLSAAGVAVLYASLFAAIKLYNLIDPASGFLVLAGLTAGAIALALRQGPFVGLLGFAGGFLTPAIVRSDEPNALVLFGYLFAIQLGSQVLRRRRGWWWPSAIAVGGGFLWAALWLANMPRGWSDDIWLAVFLLATAAAASWAQRTTFVPAKLEDWTPLHWQSPAIHAVALMLMAALVSAADFDLYGWMFLGFFAAGEMVLARFRIEHEPLAAFAAILAALLLTAWPLPFDLVTVEASRFIAVVLGAGALVAIGGFAGLWGARQPGRWALLSAIGTGAYFLIAYARLRGMDGLPPWGLVSLAIAALHVAAAERVARYRVAAPAYEEALGAFALAASFFIALAVPLELEHGWIAVGWALLLPAIAWIDSQLRIVWLRYAAWIAASLVLARLLPGPWVGSFPTGTTPIFNWLLYGYGIPLAAFVGAAWMFRRRADDGLVTLLEAGAIAIGFLLVTLELHHLFHGNLRLTVLIVRDIDIGELSCLIIAWLSIALGLLHLPGDRPALYRRMARIVAGLAIAALVLGPLLLANPLLVAQDVGAWPLLNWLIPAYLVPAVLVAVLALHLRNPDEPWLAPSLAVLSLVLGFAFVTLELRQWFHGSRLDLGGVTNAETYAYSVGWILYGVALLAAGIVRGGAALRYASLAVIVLAVGKVFLIDAAALAGLYRVASFLGLGLSLLAIGYAYQRFVFVRAPTPLASATPPPMQS